MFKDRNTGSYRTPQTRGVARVVSVCAVRVAAAQNNYELGPNPDLMNTNPTLKACEKDRRTFQKAKMVFALVSISFFGLVTWLSGTESDC